MKWPEMGDQTGSSLGDVENSHNDDELELFLKSVLDRIQNVINRSEENSTPDVVSLVQELLLTLNCTASLLLRLTDLNPDFKELTDLHECFLILFQTTREHFLNLSLANTLTSIYSSDDKVVEREHGSGPGRPKIHIPCEMLEDLRGIGFSWSKIAKVFSVSRWTVSRRVKEYDLDELQGFSDISDSELDNIIANYVSHHGRTVGQVYIAGYLQSVGLRIQRHRVRGSLVRLDPENRALRWGCVISRRVYHVPWPNSLWHLDGHHSLIRWGLVIHGCIDGFSRRIIFLKCSNNNYATSVQELFLKAVEADGGLWPSRVRVDRGVENVLVCETMVSRRGEGRGSFIAGPSTRNQRIERLWREVFRCVAHFFYYLFYALEQTRLLDVNNNLHLFILHFVFLPRINFSLKEFMMTFNDHKIRTAGNWSPNQMWINGMMNPENPLSHGELDNDPEDLCVYGEDPEGPSPFENSYNNVVVSPINIDNSALVESVVLEAVDPLEQSDEMGIDIYEKALRHVELRLGISY